MTIDWLTESPRERIERYGFVVRAYTRVDADEMVSAVTASLEHLRPWMPWIAFEPQSVVQRREFLAGWERDWAERREFNYGVFEDNRLVASTGLHRRSGPGVLEIGYWVHVAHTGRGIATLATAIMLDAAFEISAVEAVEVVHDVANTASQRVPERLGFVLVEDFVKSDDPVHRANDAAPAESGIGRRWRMLRVDWLRRGGKNH